MDYGTVASITVSGGPTTYFSFSLEDDGRVTTSVRDGRGGLTKTVSERGRRQIQEDQLGNVTYHLWPSMLGESAADMSPHGPIAVTDPLGRTTYYQYDDYGHTLAVTDPLRHTTYHEYAYFEFGAQRKIW